MNFRNKLSVSASCDGIGLYSEVEAEVGGSQTQGLPSLHDGNQSG